jgi:acetoin utilization deacetylase AcuC-like enzyme
MASPVLYHHRSSLDHDTGSHPEQPARITAIERALAERDWLGYDVRESPEVALDVLQAVHPPAYVAAIRDVCSAGGGWLDADTTVSRGSFVAALHAAGGATAMVDALFASDGATPRAGASLHRPPGHHAEAARAMGFCLFNNVAVAARRALDAHGAGRVLVLDWDVHHGNGTNDIFHGTDAVLYASIHQSPLYPGTGGAADTGSGAGAGHTVNLPVPAGSGDETFCSLVEHVVAPIARAYVPALVLLSAGFDAHDHDPLAGCRVSDDGFAAMASTMRRLADELGVPIGLVLEGGYDLDALARGVTAVLAVLGAGAASPGPATVARHPLADAAVARLAPYWPALDG